MDRIKLLKDTEEIMGTKDDFRIPNARKLEREQKSSEEAGAGGAVFLLSLQFNTRGQNSKKPFVYMSVRERFLRRLKGGNPLHLFLFHTPHAHDALLLLALTTNISCPARGGYLRFSFSTDFQTHDGSPRSETWVKHPSTREHLHLVAVQLINSMAILYLVETQSNHCLPLNKGQMHI